MYTIDVREDPDRGRTTTGPTGGEGCDHERTVYVETEADSGGSLTCQDCGTAILAGGRGGSTTDGGGLSASCRWVLTRVGGRY